MGAIDTYVGQYSNEIDHISGINLGKFVDMWRLFGCRLLTIRLETG